MMQEKTFFISGLKVFEDRDQVCFPLKFFFFFFKFLTFRVISLFLAGLGLCCSSWALSSCGSWA